MSSTETITIAGNGRLSVQYEQRRSLMRIADAADRTTLLEVSVDALLERMGIARRDAGPSRHYLLFAGRRDRPTGGLGDLVGVYRADDEARGAFHRLRQQSAGRPDWAELVALDESLRLKPVCWLGERPRRSPTTDGDASIRPGRLWRFLAVLASRTSLRRASRLHPVVAPEDRSDRASREFKLDLARWWPSGWFGPPPSLG